VKDHYPIPLIDDQLDRMCKMKYFTSLDLRSGYYQVPINKHCRKKTAFVKTLLHLGIDKTLKPLKIISDRGTAFTSDCFKTFCDLFGIQHVKIASSTPRANGQMERMNKIITSCLATSVESEEGNDWDEKLFQVQWAINSSVHSVTKRSPNEIVFSYKGLGLEENPLTQEIIQLNSEIQFNDEAEEEEIQSLLRKNQEKMKTQFDKKRREPPTYSEKDLVMVRCEAPSTGQSRKLTAKYRGPYEVVKALDNDRYLVQDIEGEQQSARIYKGILPVDRLKLVPKSE
jgi:transposase InsO family protein